MKQQQILFVTTSNMATNPRLVKEVALALSLHYKVTVIAFIFNNWSKPLNDSIKKQLGSTVNWIEISGDRKPFFPWLFSSLLQSICKKLVSLNLYNTAIISQALQKRSVLISQALKKCSKDKIDLIVAHNPGAFYPVYSFAQKNQIPFGIDVEDYHPGEYKEDVTIKQYKNLFKNILPKANYITHAAAPIGEEVLKDTFYQGTILEVLNAFPNKEFEAITPIQKNTGILKIVWFSQHISKGRGLDELLQNWHSLKDLSIELHLIGALDPSMNVWIDGFKNIIIHSPMTQSELHQFLLSCDVGLALEDKFSNYNRDLCITNKIIAYYQAGLSIIATDTLGQQSFFKRYQPNGSIIAPDELIKTIQELNPSMFINKAQPQLNWETESKKLQTLWEQVASLKK